MQQGGDLISDLFDQFVQTFSPFVRCMVEQDDGSVSVLHYHSIYEKRQLKDFTEEALLTLPSPPETKRTVTAGFCTFLRPHLSKLSSTVWTSEAIISALATDYRDRLCISRKKLGNMNRQPNTPLPLSYGTVYSDVGQYFQLLGREETYRVLLHGSLQMFRNFVSKSPTSFERREAFFAMVAFPGAGKSTFGLDFNNFMIKMWFDIPEEERMQIVRKYLIDDNLVNEYVEMLQQFENFNLCCYHTLEVAPQGTWLEKEDDLGVAQILALRCLHGAVFEPESMRYADFLSDLQGRRQGLCKSITLRDVIKVIRSCLGIEPKKRLLIGWFFDEANAARGSFPKSVTEGITWFQEILSEYVMVLDGLRKEKSPTFPIMSIGTTRFSAGTLKLTKIGRARAFVVPLRPLRIEEAKNVVMSLMHRLTITVNEQLEVTDSMPSTLELMLCFCGGIPRMIALMLKTLLDENPAASPEIMLMSMQKQRSHTEAISLLRRLLGRVSRTDYFLDYLTDPSKTAVLVRALATSVLGIPVMRQSKIVEENSAFSDTWGDLEGAGLVALNLYTSLRRGVDLRNKELMTAVDIGNIDVQVQFCPLLLFHLSDKQLALPDNKTWSFSIPNVHEQLWRNIEGAHINVLVFKLQLLRVSYKRDMFTIRDLFPLYVNIPASLRALCFEMPPENYDQLIRSLQLKTREEFWSHVKQYTMNYAFIGPGNLGADSWLCVKEMHSRKLVHFCIQSRSTISGKYVTCKKMLQSLQQDCGRWFTLPTVTQKHEIKRREIYGKDSSNETTEEGTKSLSDAFVDDEMEDAISAEMEFIYIYCTDEIVSSKTLNQLQELVAADDPWARRMILWYNTPNLGASDPLALLSLLRYIKEYPSC